MAFKAEKITGSLLLLDNLRKLTGISSVIIPYITEIEQMNIKLQPEIERNMNNISTDIKQLNIKLDGVVNTLKPLKTLLDDHKKEIEFIQKEINGKRENEHKINETEAASLYEKEHPEYTNLKNSINSLTERKNNFDSK